MKKTGVHLSEKWRRDLTAEKGVIKHDSQKRKKILRPNDVDVRYQQKGKYGILDKQRDKVNNSIKKGLLKFAVWQKFLFSNLDETENDKGSDTR